jgi:RES domain-containing protein
LNSTAWRIVKRKFRKVAFTGEGARRYGGRWNSKGTAVVYVAQSQSLAALEILSHTESEELLRYYVAISVSFDSRLVVDVDVSSLPKNWKTYPAPRSLRAIGDAWVSSGKSAVLRVPSVLVPSESNFLLNPRHPEYTNLVIGEPLRFSFDPRLFRRTLKEPASET